MKYKIEDGYDHRKGRSIYRVVGIDNDYVGEWSSSKKDMKKESQELVLKK